MARHHDREMEMGYEIVEERVVTIDGAVPKESRTSTHHALVFTGEGAFRVHMAKHAPDAAWLTVESYDQDGDVPFRPSELVRALGDLARLGPYGRDDSATREAAERAAQVVERTCEMLDPDDPVAQTHATDLRATMLSLIELADLRANGSQVVGS